MAAEVLTVSVALLHLISSSPEDLESSQASSPSCSPLVVGSLLGGSGAKHGSLGGGAPSLAEATTRLLAAAVLAASVSSAETGETAGIVSDETGVTAGTASEETEVEAAEAVVAAADSVVALGECE